MRTVTSMFFFPERVCGRPRSSRGRKARTVSLVRLELRANGPVATTTAELIAETWLSVSEMRMSPLPRRGAFTQWCANQDRQFCHIAGVL